MQARDAQIMQLLERSEEALESIRALEELMQEKRTPPDGART
jgi:hypothetical protein